MKFPPLLVSISALLVLGLIMTACGGGGVSSNHVPRNPPPPPPPPTGANYTTCAGQQVPNWQSDLFKNNYKPAIQALISNYASNPSVGYIRVGLGKGGEINLPQGWNDQSSGSCFGGYSGTWGYSVGGSTPSSSTWNSYLAEMVGFEGSLNSPKTLLVSITPVNGASTATDDFIAPIAIANHMSFGNQGLQASDITDFPNCGGDWCNLFAQYHPAIAELQTIGQSCPSGVDGAASFG